MRQDGTLGPASPGRPVALFIQTLAGSSVETFLWSDGSVGPAAVQLPPVQPAALTWTEPWGLTTLMATGMLIGLLGCALVPLSWIWPSLRTRSNCLFHAYGRMVHEGGYMLFTPSKYGWANSWVKWTHVFYLSADLAECEEYLPFAPKRAHRLPPVTYQGHRQPYVLKVESRYRKPRPSY